jgi:hypothetical protein
MTPAVFARRRLQRKASREIAGGVVSPSANVTRVCAFRRFRISESGRQSSRAAIAAALMTFSGVAAATEPGVSCADGRISAEGELEAKWREPVETLCAQFAAMKDVDPSVRIRMRAAGGNLEIEATLGDGRTAHRTLRSPDDLLTTVEALSVQIPKVDTERAVESPPAANVAPKPEPAAAPPAAAPAVREPRSEPAPTAKSRTLEVELGFAIEGRVSAAPAYLSLGGAAYAGLRPDDWFFGVIARWQPSEVPAAGPQPDFEMESAGAGFAVARRVLKTGVLGLDAGATALVLVDTQSLEGRIPDEIGASTAVRFGVLLRALVGRLPWKLAPSLDADIAPSRLRRNTRLDAALPPLPTWSVALGLGATWVGE